MYKRILVPLDGSATSTLGLNEAIGLAAQGGARLRLLNVVDEASLISAMAFPMAGIDDMIGSLRASGKQALDQAAAVAARRKVKAECVQIESRVRPVSDAILNEAKAWRADLIVMGTHGRRGMNRLLLGSDAERVLRDATVPVLLVRGDKAASARTPRRPAQKKRK